MKINVNLDYCTKQELLDLLNYIVDYIFLTYGVRLCLKSF